MWEAVVTLQLYYSSASTCQVQLQSAEAIETEQLQQPDWNTATQTLLETERHN